MAILAARTVTYEFPGKRALDAVSFEAAPGSITALVGPNGAGKTTLLRCLAVLEHPFAGAVEIDGLKGTDAPRECHARLGYLADNFGLYDALSVRQCLAHHAAIHGMTRADRRRAEDWAIERMDLKDLLGQRAGTLSRGQRQRLGVAQAIVHYPKALLLDEPASGLDPEARWKLSSLLSQLARDGMTLVVSSHILAELQDYSTHVLILREGRVALHESLSEAQKRAEGAGRASIRVELAEAAERLETVLKSFAGIGQIALHGRGATVFLPDDNAAKAALLKHLVEAGLPVIGFHEDKSRVEDVYFSLVAGQNGADAAAPKGQS